MSTTTLIAILVSIAIIGYVVCGALLYPVLRVAIRRSGAAAGVAVALAVSNSWILLFLVVLLESYLTGWDPGRVYLILAVIVAVNPWALALWWLRWRRRIDRKDEE